MMTMNPLKCSRKSGRLDRRWDSRNGPMTCVRATFISWGDVTTNLRTG